MLQVGTIVDRYVVEASLGGGGMADVYRVRHYALSTLHALKVLREDSTLLRRRLMEEGRLQAHLVHPHLVPVTDVFEAEGRQALLMPFVNGPDLAAVLRRQRPTAPASEQLFRGILAGVAHAHAHGVIHRDLKPANVLLDPGPEGLVPRVADFGIARVVEGTLHRRVGGTITRTRQFLGTPGYAAPEQVREARGVDHRADIFSLGVILYELYCGQRPFRGADPLSVLNAATLAQYVDPSHIATDLDPSVAEAIRACLRPDPDERPQGCGALADLLFPSDGLQAGSGGTWHLDATWAEGLGEGTSGQSRHTSTPRLNAGDTLVDGRYALQEPLAEGIFSTVWRALDVRAELTVALKTLHPRWAQDPQRVQAFFRGALAMATVEHPAVARVLLPEGQDGLHRFYVMEYLAGGSLFAARLDGRLDARQATDAVLQVGSGLAAAHQRGLVHRDVEPRNIVLGTGGRAYLVDFDRVSVDPDTDSGRTNPLGSVVYVAPEVHADSDAATPRSDTYSLAMCVVFALHGDDLPLAVVRDTEAFLAGLACSNAAKHLLAQAVAPDPLRRPTDLLPFLDQLRDALRQDGVHRPFVPSAERARRRLRRRAAISAGVGLLALAVTCAAGVDLRGALRELRVAQAQQRIERLTAAGWSRASTEPAEALAFLRAATEASRLLGDSDDTRLSQEQALRLGQAGARQQVVPMSDNVLGLRTSPDRSTVAAGLEDGSVVLMDPVTGEERAVIPDIADRVYKLAWSPDSSLLAAWDPRSHGPGETRGPAAVVDVAKGRIRYTLNHTGHVSSLAFSPDGRLVATASEDLVTLRNAATGVFVSHLEGTEHAGRVAWLSDDLLVTGKPAAIWSVSQGVQVANPPFDNPGWGLSQPRVTLDRKTLLYADRKGLTAWDRATGQVVSQAAQPDARWLALSPSGDRLASYFSSPDVRVWSVPDLAPVGTLVGHQSKPMAVSFDGQGRVLTASLDGTARIWSSLDGSPQGVLRGHRRGVHAATWANGVPVTGGLDATTRWWPPLAQERLHVQARFASPRAVSISADGRYVALGTATGDLWTYDAMGQEPLALAAKGIGRVDALAFSPLSSELAALVDGLPTIYDLRGELPPRRLLSQLPVAGGGITFSPKALEYLPGGEVMIWQRGYFQLPPGPPRGLRQAPELWGIAVAGERVIEVGSANPRVAATDVHTGEPRWDLTLAVHGGLGRPSPSAGGDAVAVPSYAGDLAIIDVVSGALEVAGRPHLDAITQVAWTDDDQALVTAGADGRVLLLDAVDLAVLEVIQPGGDAVLGADPSPDGRCVALVGRDGFLRLYSRDLGVVTALYDLGETLLKVMRWTADSSALVAVTSDAEVRVWDGGCSTPLPDLLAVTGGWTNLRLCPDDQTVVPVVPFPEPETIMAPVALCPADAGGPPG